MTTQQTLFAHSAPTQELPEAGSIAVWKGRRFIITHVTDTGNRIVLLCIAADTGLDAVLFLHEIDYHAC